MIRHLFIASVFISLLAIEEAQAVCDQTLSPGANIPSAMAAAAPGTTICLNSGNYGDQGQSISPPTKNPRVTIKSVTPLGAVMKLWLYNNVNGFTFDGISFTGGGLTIGAGGSNAGANNRNISILNSELGDQELYIATEGFNNNNLLIDGSTFCCYNAPSANSGAEGRIQFWSTSATTTPSGITVSNNTFGPGGCSDGIQLGARGVMIGPGNVFTNIVPSTTCDAIYGGRGNSPHIDIFQAYGEHVSVIDRNFFINSTSEVSNFGYHEGGTNETWTNNVFAIEQISLGCIQIGLFEHNTVRANTFFNGKFPPDEGSCADGSTNITMRNNLFRTGGAVNFTQNNQNRCWSPYPPATTICAPTNNQWQTAGQVPATAVNNLVGAPTFINGTPGTSCLTRATCLVIWANYQLAPGSVGKNAAADGQDMGVTYYGPGASGDTVPPAAPTNLRFQ